MTVPGFHDTPGERFPRALWCINEELQQLSTRIMCGRAIGRICCGCGSFQDGRWQPRRWSRTLQQRFLQYYCISSKIFKSEQRNNRATSIKPNCPVVSVVAKALMVTLRGFLLRAASQITLMGTVGNSLKGCRTHMAKNCVWCAWPLLEWLTLTCDRTCGAVQGVSGLVPLERFVSLVFQEQKHFYYYKGSAA